MRLVVPVVLAVLFACSSKSPPAASDEPAPAPAPAPAVVPAAADASLPDASVPDAGVPDAAQPSPVACQTDDDCWVSDDNQPIARPKSERGKKVRPCKDSSRVPACKANVCTVVGYKC